MKITPHPYFIMRLQTTLCYLALSSFAAAAPVEISKRQDGNDALGNVLGSILGTGSGNAAGNGNDATATGNVSAFIANNVLHVSYFQGNGNTGATAGASDFLNGASATENGIGNGNDGNSVFNFKRSDGNDALSNILGSIVGTGSGNSAGNDNSASAGSNGDDNTGASASASDFLNGATATGNGIGNGNDDNSVFNFKRADDATGNILGSLLGVGSGNSAGIGNSASASDNGNGNTGASASASDFLNGASATENGIGNGNDGNSVFNFEKRIAELESALLQKRSTCECDTIGSIVSTGAADLAGVADSASAINNGNGNTGASASASDFLNGATANDNGILNDNDNDTLIALPQTITIL